MKLYNECFSTWFTLLRLATQTHMTSQNTLISMGAVLINETQVTAKKKGSCTTFQWLFWDLSAIDCNGKSQKSQARHTTLGFAAV